MRSSDAGYHIEFNGKHFVVKEGTVVLTDGSLGVFVPLVGHGGAAQELTKFVPIKAAHLEFTDFLEEFLNQV